MNFLSLSLFLTLVFFLAFWMPRWMRMGSAREKQGPRGSQFGLTEFSEELSLFPPLRHRFDSALPPLPQQLGNDCLTVLVRSADSLYVYWELTAAREAAASLAYPREIWDSAPMVLRLYDVTSGQDWTVASHQEHALLPGSDHWFFHGLVPSTQYQVLVGRILSDKFIPLLISGIVKTPPAAPSSIIDPLWPPIAGLMPGFVGAFVPQEDGDVPTSPQRAWSALPSSPQGAWSSPQGAWSSPQGPWSGAPSSPQGAWANPETGGSS
ncbi:DUF4912 domain-containing protein [Heliophilum fasciatum]|uniref:Uncharacterized protein DUF4912 n=1 Tax=Heliophilum fasciatum TaxID=35700 RepID=A0A4R2RX79_9FIRM|nr:DUF4912 domain-containing protein [Heliophilum fasciatum]MCW2277253.1 hypothetical protein [Heliophilum fasciatum]TCP68113.1 uncharacterized protein DUF4912 [Heliophilum fasciatum]